MYILALDTATNSGGVAISRNQEVMGQIVLKTPLRYSDNLILMIDFLLQRLELDMSQIDLLVGAAGPGSFTGLRIGLATLKGLGQPDDIPALGISTLEAMAHRFLVHEMDVVPMFDARRQQVYSAVYHPTGRRGLELLHGPVAMRPDQWLALLDAGQPYLFVGDGSRQYRSAIEATHPTSKVIETDNQILESLCILGFQKFAAGEAQPVGDLKGIYVRPPDIRRPAG